jgi:hypothetical protein
LQLNYLPHEARYDSGESVTVWVFYLNYWAIFDTAKGVSLWLHERTCLNLSFEKSALTDGEGWKSSSGVYSGSAEWRMTWSIPISSFSALVTGETSYFYPRSHIWEWLTEFLHGKHRMGKSCLLAWCNVTAICWNLLFLVHAIYLLSLDLAATAFAVVPSTELISCYFNVCSAFILSCTLMK